MNYLPCEEALIGWDNLPYPTRNDGLWKDQHWDRYSQDFTHVNSTNVCPRYADI